MKTRIILILITLLCAAMASVQSAHAATITVTNTNDSGAGSLRQALADASDGDTTDFAVATPATITLTSGELLVNKSVTISGPSVGHLSVNGNGTSRVFHIEGVNSIGVNVTISNLIITNGADGYRGGGIFNYSPYNSPTLMITNCTISGNYAGYGGGIFNEGAVLMIINSTISGNSAGSSGGAIYHDENEHQDYGDASVTITNSTLSDNSAGYAGGGIGGDSFGGGGITIGNTILNNAATGGNIYAPNNIPNRVYSLGYNMSDDDGAGLLTGPGDQINTAPLLGPLQDNGGPTFTHALLGGSPAIDAGDPSFTPPPDYDQRGPGFDRVVNGRIDIGAFEVQPVSTPACAAQVQPPINADGSSVFTVRRGVVPAKFTLTCDGNPTCDLSPATIAVTRTAGGTTGAINESVYSMAADTGSNFRVDGCQYIYNLNSGALGVGTYQVDILINSQVVGSATFTLK